MFLMGRSFFWVLGLGYFSGFLDGGQGGKYLDKHVYIYLSFYLNMFLFKYLFMCKVKRVIPSYNSAKKVGYF